MPDPSRPKIVKTITEDKGDIRFIRHYHQNGQLVKEIRCKRMIGGERIAYHGKSRQWSSDGRFIGSFTLNEGTGVCREWYDNGQMARETSMVDGKITGLPRAWDEGGFLLGERFYYQFKHISNKKYRELQESDPNVPRYPDDAFENIAKKRKR